MDQWNKEAEFEKERQFENDVYVARDVIDSTYKFSAACMHTIKIAMRLCPHALQT